jgi:hypothetical protein
LRRSFASVITTALLVGGCAARQPTGPGAPPPGTPVQPANTYNIGGYAVNKTVFWLGMSGAMILGGVVLDNVPESASNGELDVMDFVPVGLYTVGGIFLIGAF